MIERLFLSSPWIAAALNVIAYLCHYYLFNRETQLYHSAASKVVTYEGLYEPLPNPKVIKKQRVPYWRLVVTVLSLGGFTLIVWWMALQQLQRPEVLTFLMGAWLLLMSMHILRDLRQLTLFRYWRSAGGNKGRLALSERLYIITSSTDYQVYAGFCLFLLLVTGDFFFLGGAFICFVAGRHRRDGGIVMEEPYPPARINLAQMDSGQRSF